MQQSIITSGSPPDHPLRPDPRHRLAPVGLDLGRQRARAGARTPATCTSRSTPRPGPGSATRSFPTDFTYVTPETEAAWLPALRDTLAWRYALGPEVRSLRTPRDAARMVRDLAYFESMRRRGARMVMKDPIALFSAEWLSTRFDMPVVVIIRHPAAFVA